MHAIIPDQRHIPLPQDAACVRPSTGGDGRLARLAALDADRRSEALTFLAGYAPGIFDAIVAATEPCTSDDHPAGDDALEPFCTQCGARAGIFTARGGDWLHYTGQVGDNNVHPYDTDHAPVIAWRPTPGIVVVAR